MQRGVDCTLEATIILNRTPEAILSSIADPGERQMARTLFDAIGAAQDQQATYQATSVYRQTRAGSTPRRSPACAPGRARSAALPVLQPWGDAQNRVRTGEGREPASHRAGLYRPLRALRKNASRRCWTTSTCGPARIAAAGAYLVELSDRRE